ncbi:hypothetical protein EWM64_g2856 [Hericium alpestre]|uniref:F-box domain-containing protein n=1 Tax=Hericium alpestre TaxID=135208 RepID=A0A4Z0A3X5_9AGAM|nr:hypothetical protein EWM64_g2856 [Hericium alpestre]
MAAPATVETQEYCALLNLDKKKSIKGHSNLLECTFSFRPGELVELLYVKKVTLLAKPKPLEPMLAELTKKYPCLKLKPFRRVTAASMFSRLPEEIIDMIFNELSDDCIDCISLALCSAQLWRIARPLIEDGLFKISLSRSFAGDRLICAGDYVQLGDRSLVVDTEATEKDTPELADAKRCLQHEVNKSWPGPEEQQFLPLEFVREALQARGVCNWSEDMDLFNSLRDPETMRFPPRFYGIPSDRHPRILRNLTAGEYVRESALISWKAQNSILQHDVADVTLGHICAIKIYWAVGVAPLDWDDNLHRGPWAMHRFDIVSATELEGMEEDKKTMWKDVSEEVLEELESIWNDRWAGMY